MYFNVLLLQSGSKTCNDTSLKLIALDHEKRKVSKYVLLNSRTPWAKLWTPKGFATPG